MEVNVAIAAIRKKILSKILPFKFYIQACTSTPFTPPCPCAQAIFLPLLKNTATILVCFYHAILMLAG